MKWTPEKLAALNIIGCFGHNSAHGYTDEEREIAKDEIVREVFELAYKKQGCCNYDHDDTKGGCEGHD